MSHRIFIHHNGALGDILLSIPAINTIRRYNDFVHMAGRADVVDFLEKVGYIDEKSDAESMLFLSFYTDTEEKEIKKFIGSFDKVYVFTIDKKSQLAARISSIASHAKIIQTIPPEGLKIHVSDFRLRQIRDIINNRKQERSHKQRGFQIPSYYEERAKELLADKGYDFKRPLTAIHCGSGSRRKCWPFVNFKNLIERLKIEFNHFFILFSGPAEDSELKKEIEDLELQIRNDCLYLCNPELIFVASLLSLCDIYIGNDSGITHIASFFAPRVIVLFGPTDPFLWRPLAPNTKVISAGLKCSPCEYGIPYNVLEEHSRCTHFRCMTDISVQMVFDEIKKIRIL